MAALESAFGPRRRFPPRPSSGGDGGHGPPPRFPAFRALVGRFSAPVRARRSDAAAMSRAPDVRVRERESARARGATWERDAEVSEMFFLRERRFEARGAMDDDDDNVSDDESGA